MQGVNVKSEIGNLKKVILHRPGDELLNLTPNTLFSPDHFEQYMGQSMAHREEAGRYADYD